MIEQLYRPENSYRFLTDASYLAHLVPLVVLSFINESVPNQEG